MMIAGGPEEFSIRIKRTTFIDQVNGAQGRVDVVQQYRHGKWEDVPIVNETIETGEMKPLPNEGEEE